MFLLTNSSHSDFYIGMDVKRLTKKVVLRYKLLKIEKFCQFKFQISKTLFFN